MNYKRLSEKARAVLILYYGISELAKQQIAKFILYGGV